MKRPEPTIAVGIVERAGDVRGVMRGPYATPGCSQTSGAFHVIVERSTVFVIDEHESIVASGPSVRFRQRGPSSFVLNDVTIGIGFHWERREDQEFTGDLELIAVDGTITVVNHVGLETYLASVISSEMSATSPYELLRAHAITSRSWLIAMLDRRRTGSSSPTPAGTATEAGEIVRWYGREDHALFDVCADDHCQRYQGTTKIVSPHAGRAVGDTAGTVLVAGGSVCDARYYKACGGRTEEFRSAWEDIDVPYLRSVPDGADVPVVRTEKDAEAFIASRPKAFCNTADAELLRSILPAFDQETADFFRWEVRYTWDELSSLVAERSGIAFGRIEDLVPLERGPSGRITRLRVVGTERTVVVGKELEIRKWLSRSHLYSSAFVVQTSKDGVTLRGAGWGHGVGLCQIGAAVMASKGRKAEEIVLHYFPGAALETLYGAPTTKEPT